MSISMERFINEGEFSSYDPDPKTHGREEVFGVQCHCCGFEPEQAVTPPRICPKCHSAAWERFVKPGSILRNADRFVA